MRNLLDIDYKPFLDRLAYVPGGVSVTVKTYACNEIQLRLGRARQTTYRKDSKVAAPAMRAKRDSALVFNAISQTCMETGEIKGETRRRRFTSHAKHFIREAGAVLEQTYGKDIYFITLTLPGSSVNAVEAFAAYDKHLRNAFLQNFRKLFGKVIRDKRRSLDYVCVSELQKRGAIHFHIALGLPSLRFAKLVKRLYRQWWLKLLEKYSKKSGADLFKRGDGTSVPRTTRHLHLDCSRVRKSVAGYLAKYLSKSQTKSASGAINDPSRYWSVSSALRERAITARRSETFRETSWQEAKETIENSAQVLREQGVEWREMRNPYNGDFLGFVAYPSKQLVGWYYEWARELCRASVRIQLPNAARVHVSEWLYEG